jgi:hypothetical protein
MMSQTATSNPVDDFSRKFIETLIKDWEEKNKKKQEHKTRPSDILKTCFILMVLGPPIAMVILLAYYKLAIMFAQIILK